MALLTKSKITIVALFFAATLSGCGAEYMNNWDRNSTRAGDAHESNTAIQEITAWPPYVEDTTITHGG